MNTRYRYPNPFTEDLLRYPACTPASLYAAKRILARIYLPDLPARVSSLLGCLAIMLCLSTISLISRIRAGKSRENPSGFPIIASPAFDVVTVLGPT